MKRPLKAREVALILLPSLALGGFGWYQSQRERAGGHSDGMFVSSVEFKPALGRFQAQGMSHEMTVSIGHTWPRPSWWNDWKIQTGADPIRDTKQQVPGGGFTTQQVIASGAVLTTTSLQDGKPIIKVQWRDNRIGCPLESNLLRFSHEMPLAKIPASAGEVTFRGLYLIGAQDPIRVTRVVRKTGEVIPFKSDQNANGHIVSTKADAFETSISISGKTKTVSALCNVHFVVTRTLSGEAKPNVQIENMKIRDGHGKVCVPYSTPGLYNEWSNEDWGSSANPDVNTTGPIVGLEFAPSLKTANPLTFSGTVSIDDGWPIPFSVRLPPR